MKENAERKLGKGAATGRRETEQAKESEPKANFKRDGDVARKWSSCSIYLFFPQAKTSDTSDLIDCRDEEGQRQNN